MREKGDEKTQNILQIYGKNTFKARSGSTFSGISFAGRVRVCCDEIFLQRRRRKHVSRQCRSGIHAACSGSTGIGIYKSWR